MNVQSKSVSKPDGGCGPLVGLSEPDVRNLRQLLFERVRAAGAIPRVDLARQLGVSPGTVTVLSGELIDRGLVREVTSGKRESDTGRGRPPVALSVQPKAAYVVGINLSDLVSSAFVADFSGGRVACARLPRDGTAHSPDATLSEIEAVLDAALSEAKLNRKDISRVGLGLPGVIDHREGVILWSPLSTEPAFSIARLLSARIGIPVHVENDANIAAMAELWFGKGRSLKDFAVVTIEHGLGMGLVMNHKLYRGANGIGMEIGHTKVHLDGALCRCGQRGCLEAYVADYALVREARTALNLGNRGVTSPQELLENLYGHAKSGNQGARAIFDRAGRYLSMGLANVATLLDPPLILLSGERMRYDYLFAEEVLAEMDALTLDTGRPLPKVEIHAWGDLVWAHGAAALALDAATQDAFEVGSLLQ